MEKIYESNKTAPLVFAQYYMRDTLFSYYLARPVFLDRVSLRGCIVDTRNNRKEKKGKGKADLRRRRDRACARRRNHFCDHDVSCGVQLC